MNIPLAQAEQTFEEDKTSDNALKLLDCAKVAWNVAEISDDDFASRLRLIAYWLEFN